MRRHSTALALIFAAELAGLACGEVLAEAPDDSADAAADGSTDAGDAGEAGAASCSTATPFGSIEMHPVLAPSPFEENGYWPLGSSGVTYFARNTKGIADSRVFVFDPPADAGQGAALVLSKPDGAPAPDFRHPTFTSDGKTLFYSTIYGASVRVHGTRRASVNDLSFPDDPAWIAEPSTGHDQRAPFVAGDELWFAAAPAGTTDYDLYFAGLDANGRVAPAEKLPSNINTGAYPELDPVLAADGLTLYFSTTRPGLGSKGQDDIWMTTRVDRSAAWSDPKPVPELNSTFVDHATWLSPDNCTLVFVSTRNGSQTNHLDLFVAKRTP